MNGSGISLGHPIAATGTMRMVTLLYELRRRNARYGLETICGGGGHGIAAIVARDVPQRGRAGLRPRQGCVPARFLFPPILDPRHNRL